jgi:alpha-mannosidase
MRKQVVAYLHTHWDREWYREFEVFRMRLLRVFDNILNLLDTNQIPCFYFDGQVSALDDYLEIRPEKEPLVRALIRSKKLFVGPFYCLVDEFLTDKICFSKNLELGMKRAIELGCTDFIGYLPDTFGHSSNVVDILRDFGIDKAIVWRGCGDFPADFKWCGMDTVNLVRGYFNDVFALNCDVEKKAELLKKNLDLIAEKSGNYILLPVGADHLGVPKDIKDQILAVNEILKEDYNIVLGSPFDYLKNVDDFEQFKYDDELRDNSKTFILSGSYSSRLDLKRYNVECSYKLDLVSRYVRFCKLENKYELLLDYAYKMLVRNQAHDSICGCSIDEVHSENIMRYKKILQIADTIIDELKFETKFGDKYILNLSENAYSGVIEFETTEKLSDFELFSTRKGFDKSLLTDTLRIPVTEDYCNIYKYLAEVKELEPDKISFFSPILEESDLIITDKSLENSNIKLEIKDNDVFVNGIRVSLIDFVDIGDSYNSAPKVDDKGREYKVSRSKISYSGKLRAVLRIDFEGAWDIVTLNVLLDKNSTYLKFEFDWVNSTKNHLLELRFELPTEISTVYSEDMNSIIKREFDPSYNIRENLPKTKGIEVKTNTAPIQRGLLIDEAKNNIGVVTKGLTQYEVFENNLYLPLLRSTGVISNPANPARTTPAGPPIETPDLQMLTENRAELNLFFGNKNDFENVLEQVYCLVIE